jgi:hypothetical protein
MGATRAKDHLAPNAFTFGTPLVLAFPQVTVTANQVNSGIATRIFLPTAVKIYRVVAGFASGAAGVVSLNIVAGIAAEAGTLPIPDTDYANQPLPAYPPAYASAGQQLFLTDQPITVANNASTILTPSDSAATGAYPAGTPGNTWDALWGPAGSLLTLRLVSNGAGAGNLNVSLLAKVYDPTYNKPVLTSFSPAVDIP